MREARSTFSKIFTPSTACGGAERIGERPHPARSLPGNMPAGVHASLAKSAFASCGHAAALKLGSNVP
jgi:hypothetical protein